jgi:predicted kinase
VPRPQAYLLVGLTGAGKTTYAQRVLEPVGVTRLSVDELVYARHGRYGVDYPTEIYFDLYGPALDEIRVQVDAYLEAGRDVALDLGIWRRADRDEWKARITAAGATWRLLYFPVSRAELLERLIGRNRLEGANALRVTGSDLDDFYARFEEPLDEGEEVIQPGSY